MPSFRTTTCSLIALSFGLLAVACDGSDDSGGASTSSSSGGGSSSGSTTSSSGGEACSAAAAPTDLEHDVEGPFGRAAVDGDFVFVPGAVDGGEGVLRFPRAGGAGVPLATTPLMNAVPDRAVVAGGSVWFVGGSTGNVYKVPTAGGAATYEIVASGYSFFSQRRLVADAESVYVLGWKGPKAVIDRIPLAGGAAETILELPSGQYNIALHGADVFYSGGAITDVAVRRVPKAGGTPETVVPGKQCLNGLAVTDDAVFCADTNALTRIARAAGNASTVLYSTPGLETDRVEDAVVSEDGSVAYVADGMHHANERMGRIVRVDVASGTKTSIACDVAPVQQLALGPASLVATGTFVGLSGKYDVQLLAR